MAWAPRTLALKGRFTPQGLREIVGVVEDGKYFALAEEARPTVSWPTTQRYAASMTIVVRSTLSDREVTEQLRGVVQAIDPQIPLYVEGTLSDAIAFAFLPARAATIALGAFGLLAIVLALVGIYGLAGYSVTARTREIGIRLAIGARSHQVLCSILGRTAIVLIAGGCIGGAAGLALSRLLTAIVYHASAHDPMVMLGVGFTMILIGLGAAWLPAQRALAVDPARTLREG